MENRNLIVSGETERQREQYCSPSYFGKAWLDFFQYFISICENLGAEIFSSSSPNAEEGFKVISITRYFMRTKQECFHNATSIIFTSKNFPLYAGGFKFKNSWSRIARNRTVIENKDIFWCPKNPQGKKNELLDLLIQKSKIFNPGAAGCHQMVAYTF